jgi:hypothetical protein
MRFTNKKGIKMANTVECPKCGYFSSSVDSDGCVWCHKDSSGKSNIDRMQENPPTREVGGDHQVVPA